jgi:hypothetical protein
MKQTFEIVLIVDANGDYAVGADYDNATENYDNEVGGGAARRVITIRANVALPEEPEVVVDVPDMAGQKIEATAE